MLSPCLDSTVLAYVLKLLNDRYSYGLDLVLLSIDEGITGYRDDSLETVKRNRDQYQIPLLIVSYKDLYGWSMDDIVKEIGRKNNCESWRAGLNQMSNNWSLMIPFDRYILWRVPPTSARQRSHHVECRSYCDWTQRRRYCRNGSYE